MKHYSLVVARIRPSENVLVVPFAQTLDFAVKRSLSDAEFVALMHKLGINSDEAELKLAMTYHAPVGFEVPLELSDEQVNCLHSCFPSLAENVCLTA
jgi:NAD-dependent oxidoreductase involved in siderophore biosynthesis